MSCSGVPNRMPDLIRSPRGPWMANLESDISSRNPSFTPYRSPATRKGIPDVRSFIARSGYCLSSKTSPWTYLWSRKAPPLIVIKSLFDVCEANRFSQHSRGACVPRKGTGLVFIIQERKWFPPLRLTQSFSVFLCHIFIYMCFALTGLAVANTRAVIPRPLRDVVDHFGDNWFVSAPKRSRERIKRGLARALGCNIERRKNHGFFLSTFGGWVGIYEHIYFSLRPLVHALPRFFIRTPLFVLSAVAWANVVCSQLSITFEFPPLRTSTILSMALSYSLFTYIVLCKPWSPRHFCAGFFESRFVSWVPLQLSMSRKFS